MDQRFKIGFDYYPDDWLKDRFRFPSGCFPDFRGSWYDEADFVILLVATRLVTPFTAKDRR